MIAATFIGGAGVLDLAATLPLPLGVAGREGSTMIVGLNGLRLLHSAAWRSVHFHPSYGDHPPRIAADQAVWLNSLGCVTRVDRRYQTSRQPAAETAAIPLAHA
jgi:hypothetical protein